ncbi:MAG: hypothetical protein HDS67_05870 [Bacteroidales bacterium]|nr:hypothetical protein [Bacteroidales bacterium]
MKRLFTLLSVLVLFAGVVRAEWENYFKEGTKWEMFTVAFPLGEDIYITTTAELVDPQVFDGKECYVAVKSTSSHPEPERCAYIHVDGDKVYFRNIVDPESVWYLAYDFGLKPGEGCYVYSIPTNMNGNADPYRSYVKCVGTDLVDGLEALVMIESREDVTEEPTEEELKYADRWIKGIGSTTDWFQPNVFGPGWVGDYYTDLTLVTYNGQTIYSNPTASVEEIEPAESTVSDAYDLQGRPVGSSAKGLIIERRGDKVLKTIRR